MQQTHKRSKTTHQRFEPFKFYMQLYSQSQDPENYLLNLLKNWCLMYKINQQNMNIKQVERLTQQLPFKLKAKQIHELYLYATFENGKSRKINNMTALSIINLHSHKINLTLISKWLQKYLQKNKNRAYKQKMPSSNRLSQISSADIKVKKQMLPIIKTRPTERFTSQVTKVLSLFSEMQKQRQNAGLEPICISSDEESDHKQPIKQIHYDGDFYQVNQKLFKLRQQAKNGIYQIIEASKHDKKLKQKFQEALVRYQRVRTEANQKNGRCGAMKAQKRLYDKQNQEIKKLQKWRKRTHQTQFSTYQY